MKINLITLGCSKNTVDSENLAGALTANGHTVYFDGHSATLPPSHSATPPPHFDTVIINTCGFIGDAKEESINTILSAVGGKQRVIVCGCLVERYRDELAKEIPEVDAWYGVHEWQQIVQSLSANTDKPLSHPLTRPLSTPSHYAYLKIAEGCSRSCSYCAIPLIRGAHRSRPIDTIVEESKNLVRNGVKELLVISQDTTWYGLDLYHRRALGELLNRLAEESGAPWIRLHYTYPSSFPEDAIDAIAHHPNICNYIDIPLQHINTRILTSMQRGIDRDGTLRLIDSFREQIPDVAIRTTLIVGYPGETEAEFEELKRFVADARFDRMGCFAYSPEDGTPAEALGDPVPDEEKQRRVSELMALQESISLEKNQARVGKVYRCLLDRCEGDYLVGRTEYDSPEVDNEVLIKMPEVPSVTQSPSHSVAPGDFTSVRITSALEHDLYAELV